MNEIMIQEQEGRTYPFPPPPPKKRAHVSSETQPGYSAEHSAVASLPPSPKKEYM